jgi:hypothetical protein
MIEINAGFGRKTRSKNIPSQMPVDGIKIPVDDNFLICTDMDNAAVDTAAHDTGAAPLEGGSAASAADTCFNGPDAGSGAADDGADGRPANRIKTERDDENETIGSGAADTGFSGPDAGSDGADARPAKRTRTESDGENESVATSSVVISSVDNGHTSATIAKDKKHVAAKHYSSIVYRKLDKQQYFFLAGFGRGKYFRYPHVNPDGTLTFVPIAEVLEIPPNQNLYNIGNDWLNAKLNKGYSIENMHNELNTLAKILCQDDSVNKMFCLSGKGEHPKYLLALKSGVNGPKPLKFLSQMMVGFDWFGDEFGHPFCFFSHPDFIDIVKTCVGRNSKFGVRLHAGEGLIRPCSTDEFNSPASIAFVLHLYVLMTSIRKYCENYRKHIEEPVNLRIGHGVAFLYGLEDWIPGSLTTSPSVLSRDVHDFRTFLISNKFVCELSPTSNHMLLPDSFCGDGGLSNSRTLTAYLKAKLPVVLCTDDDGIWALQKCVSHHRHISVAHEFCNAIQNEELTSADLKALMDAAIDAKFWPPAGAHK